MTTTILKHALDPDGVKAYWKEMIDTGFHLSRRILERVDFSKGDFYTLLPETADLEKLYDFQTGLLPPKGEPFKITGGVAVEVPSLWEELSLLVSSYLEMGKENFAIYEHPTVYSHFPSFETLRGQNICRGREVYMVTASEAPKELVAWCVSKATKVWHCLIVLTKGEVPSGPELTDAMIDAIIDNVSCIIISAYDGEGYLFWEPNK